MQESPHSTSPGADVRTLRRPWLAIALLVLVAALCTSLGFWQLGRAGESRAVAERIEAARALPASPLRTADGADETLRYREVAVRGRYVPERQILIDNIVHDGIAGYYVLTPFEPDDGGPWVIVNRGWVRAGADRSVLPDVDVGGQMQRVEGRLDKLPSAGLRLGDEPLERRDAPVRVMQFPTMEQLEQVLGRRLFGYQLLLGPEQPDGFARDFPAPGLRPERHLGYAVQWWLFAAIAAGAASVIGARALRRRT